MSATVTRITAADIVASIAHKRGLAISTDPADILADHLSALCDFEGDDTLHDRGPFARGCPDSRASQSSDADARSRAILTPLLR